MIRALIVDDHAIVRQGLKRILDEAPGMVVGGEAVNGVQALKMIRAEKWDIVLLDISMPEKNGIDALKQIMDENKSVKVLILSMYPEDQYAVRMMKAGASGYMTKETAPEQLVEAIRQVVAGKKYISATLSELLLFECGSDSAKSPHETLSDREYQVLRLIGSGKTVSEVAKLLSLSVKTVSTYRSHILDKMNLRNNAELTLYVIQNGLMGP
ncbi:response regulator [Gallionella capsiferriformans]|jgi:DNA-binding NarL/FixJ family response regulator|uniref:Two component transcriptional regulator, LuxR family n=1 Tax=Gallionella capsiferriformans (strain ES-2) TaxID=395494 RepID=D9SHX8_GALCS|nr:response regulator transcription factor [Gallionella capsiferriformans]ADL56067.1 two component transcriptional regulator, LuxR family [Gallionella capsiferriformans ES-2]